MFSSAMFFRLEVISSWYSVQRKLEVDRSHAVPPWEAKLQTRLACSGNFSAKLSLSCFLLSTSDGLQLPIPLKRF